MSRPELSANFAISADGKISSAAHRPSGWTSAEDHRMLLERRRGAGALLVGRGTWQTDRMTLRVPEPAEGGQPLRCVVSRSGDFDLAHPMFRTPGGPIHLLLAATAGEAREARVADETGAVVHRCGLGEFLETLTRAHGVRRVHCEGGGMLFRELLEIDAVDTLYLTWAAHTLFGGANAPTISGPPGAFLSASRAFELVDFEPRPDLGECFLTYRRKREA